MEEPSQFSVGQTAQSLTCSIMNHMYKVWWLSENPTHALEQGCLDLRSAAHAAGLDDLAVLAEAQHAGGRHLGPMRTRTVLEKAFRNIPLFWAPKSYQTPEICAKKFSKWVLQMSCEPIFRTFLAQASCASLDAPQRFSQLESDSFNTNES